MSRTLYRAPCERRRPWPPPQALAIVIGLLLAVFFIRRPTGAIDEPRIAKADWPTQESRNDSLRIDLQSPKSTPAVSRFSAAGVSFQARPSVSRAAKDNGFMRGVALGLFSKDVNYDYDHLIGEIAAHDANWTSLVFNMFQADYASVRMDPPTRIIDQERIILRSAGQAHERGLKVMLFPLVLLEKSDSTHWRGDLKPTDVESWFRHYGRHITRLARLAQSAGIEAFSIGSEFSSLEDQVDQWKSLIAEVRSVYSGKILYSANWDHFRHVRFWRDVDIIGLSGYYEISTTATPTIEQLTHNWVRVRDWIMQWRRERKLERPIVFTEIGYANQDGASMHPWDYTRRATPDPEEQALCYESFIRAWHGQEGLGGVFFYNWFGLDSLADTGYSPRGKPAAQTMKTWFDVLSAQSL